MPRKSPTETPAATPAESPAPAFSALSDILARIAQEGEDAVYVQVWRHREDEVQPERCHDYPARGFAIDKVREHFGPGDYTLAIHRTATHAYVTRRRIRISAPPRGLDAPTHAPAPTSTADAGGPNALALMRELMAESRAQSAAMLQALTASRQTAGDLTIRDLLPLLAAKERAPLQEFASILELGRKMAPRPLPAPATVIEPDDDEREGGIGAILERIIGNVAAQVLSGQAPPGSSTSGLAGTKRVTNQAEPRAAGPVAPPPQPAGAAQPQPPHSPHSPTSDENPIARSLRQCGPVLMAGARSDGDPDTYAEIIDDALQPALSSIPGLDAIIAGSDPAEIVKLALSTCPELAAFEPWAARVAASLRERFNPTPPPAMPGDPQ